MSLLFFLLSCLCSCHCEVSALKRIAAGGLRVTEIIEYVVLKTEIKIILKTEQSCFKHCFYFFIISSPFQYLIKADSCSYLLSFL